MPAVTRNESKKPRNRIPSAKARENSKNNQRLSIKRAKSIKTRTPPPPQSESSSSSRLESDNEGNISIDISGQKYTLSTCCILNKEEIFQDSDILRLDEFSWHMWNVQCIRKLQKAADNGGFETEWVNGRAVITARGIAKANGLGIAVEDESGWRKVENFLEDWMKKGKQDITVKLMAQWKKKKGNDDVQEDGHIYAEKPKAMI